MTTCCLQCAYPNSTPANFCSHCGAALRADANPETEARGSARRFQKLIENGPENIALYDAEGRILYQSPGVLRLVGYELEELLGRIGMEFTHPDDLPDILKTLDTVVRSPNVPIRTEVRARRKDGTYRLLDMVATNLLDDPDVGAIVANYRDITERRAVEAAQRDLRERYELILRGANVGIWDVDMAGGRLNVATRFEELTGYDPHSLITDFDGFLFVVHPEDRDMLRQAAELHFAHRGPYDVTYRLKTSWGEYRWYHTTGQATWNESGTPVRFAGSTSDVTKQMETLRALQASEERHAILAKGVNDGIWDWNILSHEEFHSTRWNEILGYADGELPNEYQSFRSLIHPLDRTVVDEALRRHFEFGERYSVEIRLRHKDGGYRWVLSRGESTRDEDGRPIRMVGSISDITDRRLAEEALLESQACYRAMIDSLAEGILMQDASGRLITCNRRAEEILGLTRNELANRLNSGAPLHVINEEGEEVPYAKLPSTVCLGNGRPSYDTVLGVDRAGERRWISINAVPIFSSYSSKPTSVVTSFHDVTTLRRSIESAEANEAKLRAILEAEPECVKLIDSDGRLLEINAAGVKFIEASSVEEALRCNLFEIISPEHHDVYRRQITDALRGIASCSELQIVGLQGTRRWMEHHVVGLPDPQLNGAYTIALAVARDITQRKSSEEQMTSLRNQLAHAGRLGVMGEMAAGLAHELNQPLAAVHLDAETALRFCNEATPPALEDILRRISTQTLRAGEIIRRMRAFVRRGTGRREPADLRVLIQEVLQILNNEIVRARISLEIQLADILPARIDSIQIQQVLVNLIRNALEAMSESAAARRLTISTSMERDMVRVSIADTGPGLSPALKEKLFHPFQTTKSTGLGLGLPICRSIIEAHGGEIDAAPRSEGGMDFYFHLPLQSEDSSVR